MGKSRSTITEGAIIPSIVMFSLPLLGSSLIQLLYSTVDLLFVGRFTGKAGAAAVGSGSLIFACLIGLFTGLAVGVNVLIARFMGARKLQEASRAAHTALVLGFFGSLILTALGVSSAELLLKLLRTPPEILGEAVSYMKIYFLSMSSMVLYNMGSSILRACGDSKTPFYILVAGGLANVAADYLMVAVWSLGVTGAAVATAISQTISAVGVLWYLVRGSSQIPIRARSLCLDWPLAGRILQVGLPAGIQSVMMTLSNIIVQWYINGYGDAAMAAFAAYFRIENFIYMPMMAFGQAITTFVGQNLGAGNKSRVKKGTFVTALLAVAVSIAMAALLLAFRHPVFRCFVDDGQVVEIGVQVLAVTFPFYWLYGILEVTGGAVRGMGRAFSAMCVSLCCLSGARICMLWVITKFVEGIRGIAVVYPLTWLLAAGAMAWICRKSSAWRC